MTRHKFRDILATVAAKLTNEQWQALKRDPGKPLRVEDEKTHEVLFLVSADVVPTLWGDYVHAEVNKGLAAYDQGRVLELDMQDVLTQAHRRHEPADSGTSEWHARSASLRRRPRCHPHEARDHDAEL